MSRSVGRSVGWWFQLAKRDTDNAPWWCWSSSSEIRILIMRLPVNYIVKLEQECKCCCESTTLRIRTVKSFILFNSYV